MYTTTHTLRFNEVDGANIIFFSRVFEMCHAAFEETLESVGYPLRDILETKEWGMPLAHAEADFIRPMYLGDRLTIEVSVAEIGQRSLTWGFAIKGEDGSLRAKVRHVHVAITRRTFEARDVPEEFLEALGISR